MVRSFLVLLFLNSCRHLRFCRERWEFVNVCLFCHLPHFGFLSEVGHLKAAVVAFSSSLVSLLLVVDFPIVLSELVFVVEGLF